MLFTSAIELILTVLACAMIVTFLVGVMLCAVENVRYKYKMEYISKLAGAIMKGMENVAKEMEKRSQEKHSL